MRSGNTRSPYYRRPDLVSRLVMISGAPWHSGDRDGIKGGISEEFTNWANNELASGGQVCAQFYANLYGRYMFKTDPGPAVGTWFLNMGLATPMYVLDTYRSSLKAADHRDRPSVTRPVMIAHGRHDNKQRYEERYTSPSTCPTPGSSASRTARIFRSSKR